MQTKTYLVFSLTSLIFFSIPAVANYYEECQSEGCDTEETEELHESYESECFEENCDIEEVREIAGRRGSINAMINDFQARGWAFNACDRVGPCTASPGNNTTSRDVFYGALCTQASINQHWSDFDFDKGDWDGGFGYNDPCNINLPLGRTFNALNLLDFYGTSKPAGSSNWLPWFYSFASNAIDELDGRCGSGCPGACAGCGSFTNAINFRGLDDRTELYWPFFYAQNVFGRASIIVHEARHADGKGHNGGTTCGNGGSCDTTWAYNGANRYQVLYLWWLRAVGTGMTTAMRNQIQTVGNALLGTGGTFNTPPTNAAVYGAGATNPTALFSIP